MKLVPRPLSLVRPVRLVRSLRPKPSAVVTFAALVALGGAGRSLAGCSASSGSSPSTGTLPPSGSAAPSSSASSSSGSASDAASVRDAASAEAKGKAIASKLAQFSPAALTANVAGLPAEETHALDKLISAARLMDPIYDRQVWAGNPALRATLAADTSAQGRDVLRYFDVMRGPWDRQDAWKPFATDTPHPKGAGFYPEDLTAESFKAYVSGLASDASGAKPTRAGAVAKRPKSEPAEVTLDSLTTVVKREGDKLVAIPYSKEYAEWLQPAAKLLDEAAALTKNRSLAVFLKARAAAFLSDQYRQSDKDWMDLDSRVEATIGPYETYEDELLGQKAAFEAYITVSDPLESAKLDKYKKLLPAMEQNLPIPEGAHGRRGGDSPIRVVDLVFSSGEARVSVQTSAFNLPNDEVVRKEKGAKKVLLRNVIDTKFERIMLPIASQILDPVQLSLVSKEAFFDEILFHELSHSLGPAYVKGTKDKEVRVALESSYSALEECKADVLGAYNVLFLIKRGDLPKALHDPLLVSYFAGLFRGIRFGVAEAHGKGSAVQINRYLEAGAATLDPSTRKLKVDLPKLEVAIGVLAHDLAVVQWQGDKASADAMLGKYGLLGDSLRAVVSDLANIPVDFRPYYPLAHETDMSGPM